MTDRNDHRTRLSNVDSMLSEGAAPALPASGLNRKRKRSRHTDNGDETSGCTGELFTHDALLAADILEDFDPKTARKVKRLMMSGNFHYRWDEATCALEMAWQDANVTARLETGKHMLLHIEGIPPKVLPEGDFVSIRFKTYLPQNGVLREKSDIRFSSGVKISDSHLVFTLSLETLFGWIASATRGDIAWVSVGPSDTMHGNGKNAFATHEYDFSAASFFFRLPDPESPNPIPVRWKALFDGNSSETTTALPYDLIEKLLKAAPWIWELPLERNLRNLT